MAKEQLKKITLVVLIAIIGIGGYFIYQENRTLTPEEAKQVLLKKANDGDANAQFRVGVNYYQGWNGYALNYEKSLEYFKKSADGGNIKAAFNVGVAYLNGEGVASNNDNAIKYLKKVVDSGEKNDLVANAYFVLSGIYWANDDKSSSYYNPKLSLEYMLKAKELGYHLATYTLGLYYTTGFGVEKDVNKGVGLIKEALNKSPNNIEFMTTIGDIYNENNDYKNAATYYKMALEKGSNSVAYTYLYDMTKANEKEEGIKFIKEMASKNAGCATVLAHLYINNNLIPSSDKEVIELLNLGVKNSIPEADFLYGLAYYNEKFNLKGSKEALKFFNLGLNTKSLTYQLDGQILAQMYLNGDGTTKNTTKAIDVLRKLSRNGDYSATKSLIDIYSNKNLREFNINVANEYKNRLNTLSKSNKQLDILNTIFGNDLVTNETKNVVNVEELRRKIRANIVLPKSIVGNPPTVIRIEQDDNGNVTKVTLIKSSGNKELDNAVILGINNASPLPIVNDSDKNHIFEMTYFPYQIDNADKSKAIEKDNFLKELKLEEEKIKAQRKSSSN